jgi:hypothetical protein
MTSINVKRKSIVLDYFGVLGIGLALAVLHRFQVRRR